jgi:hypothetical protein
VAVVDDFVTHVDWRPVFLERALNNLNGAFNTGAKTAGLGKNHLQHAHCLQTF